MSKESQEIPGQTPDLGATAPVTEQSINPGLSATLSALEGLSGENELRQGMEVLEKAKASSEQVVAPEEEAPAIDPNDTGKVANDLLKDAVKPEEKSKEELEATEDKEEKPEDGEKSEEKPEGESEEEKSSLKITSPVFGGEKKVGDNKAGAPKAPELEGSDAYNNYIKENTGVENIESLVKDYTENKEKISTFDKVVAEKNNLEEVFKQLPTELYKGVEAFLAGKDWKKPIVSSPNMDFTKDIEGQGDKNLVENYFPGQFTDAEWENYNSDDQDAGIKKAIDLAKETARSQFSADKSKLDSYRDDQVKSANEFNKKMNTSVEASLEHLKGSIEGIDDGYIKQVKNDLTIESLNELFLNPDGTWKESAALSLTMAKQGYDLLEQYKTIAKHQSQTKERQEILERTPAKAKAKTSSEEKSGGISPEVQKQIDEIMKGTGSSNIY